MKVKGIRGLSAAGLLLLTLQLLVYLFEYVINLGDIIRFVFENWPGLVGFVLFLCLFIKNRLGANFILTLIGILLWVAQFCVTLTAFDNEFMATFLYSAAGVMGVGFMLISLIVGAVIDRNENLYESDK